MSTGVLRDFVQWSRNRQALLLLPLLITSCASAPAAHGTGALVVSSNDLWSQMVSQSAASEASFYDRIGRMSLKQYFAYETDAAPDVNLIIDGKLLPNPRQTFVQHTSQLVALSSLYSNVKDWWSAAGLTPASLTTEADYKAALASYINPPNLSLLGVSAKAGCPVNLLQAVALAYQFGRLAPSILNGGARAVARERALYEAGRQLTTEEHAFSTTIDAATLRQDVDRNIAHALNANEYAVTLAVHGNPTILADQFSWAALQTSLVANPNPDDPPEAYYPVLSDLEQRATSASVYQLNQGLPAVPLPGTIFVPESANGQIVGGHYQDAGAEEAQPEGSCSSESD